MAVPVALIVGLLLQPATSAARTAVVGGQSIVLAAPSPFVEVSTLFPDGFAVRQRTIPKTHTLLAWFMPDVAAQSRSGVTPPHVALQIQSYGPLAGGRYTTAEVAQIAAELEAQQPEFLRGFKGAFEEVLKRFELQSIKPQTLGLVDQGPDFAMMGLVLSDSEAGDSRVVLSSFFLVRGKFVLLVATGRNATASEMQSLRRLMGQWMATMRSANRP